MRFGRSTLCPRYRLPLDFYFVGLCDTSNIQLHAIPLGMDGRGKFVVVLLEKAVDHLATGRHPLSRALCVTSILPIRLKITYCIVKLLDVAVDLVFRLRSVDPA